MKAYQWMETFGQDIRLAMRGLRKSPGFLAVVVLSLALGIGANSTIFSMLNALLYRPLPYQHPEQLTVIWETEKEHPGDWQSPPIAELVDWKKQSTAFQDIALTSNTEEVIMSRSGEPEPIHVQYVTPNFFSFLGVQPSLGRVFTADEMQDHSYAVVISNAFWKNHFNNDPQILGKTLTVDSVPSTVVGVMPAGFAPFYGGRLDLWIPVNSESSRYSARIDHWLMPVGRLKPGVTVAQAQVEMDVIAQRLELAYPKTNKGVGKVVRPLQKDLYRWAGQALYPLLGAVGCVLLIANGDASKRVFSASGAGSGAKAPDAAAVCRERSVGASGRSSGNSAGVLGYSDLAQDAGRFSECREHQHRWTGAAVYAGSFAANGWNFWTGAGAEGVKSGFERYAAGRRREDRGGFARHHAAGVGSVGSGAGDGAACGRGIDDQHHPAVAAGESGL
jgi:hypothetical protein